MPDVDLTEMDLALIRCLHASAGAGEDGVLPPDLVPCLCDHFPGYDEVSMREGESITRLRGRELVALGPDGRLRLSPSGRELAEGLEIDDQPQSSG